MKIPQSIKRRLNKFLYKTIEETEDYLIMKDRVGVYIECKKCGAKSYDPEHVKADKCPNCGEKWE